MNDQTNDAGAATQVELEQLHRTVARVYLDLIAKYERGEFTDLSGSPKPVPASLLASCQKFLADNKVDSPTRKVDPVDRLNDELPDLSNVETK